MKTPKSIVFAVVLMLVAVCSPIARAVEKERPLVTAMRVPDRGIYPQAAMDRDGVLHLVYFKGEPMHGDAFYVRSRDGGATFSKPVRVNSQAGSVMVTGTVRGPHLAIGRSCR